MNFALTFELTDTDLYFVDTLRRRDGRDVIFRMALELGLSELRRAADRQHREDLEQRIIEKTAYFTACNEAHQIGKPQRLTPEDDRMHERRASRTATPAVAHEKN
jgi:hypothetical protein